MRKLRNPAGLALMALALLVGTAMAADGGGALPGYQRYEQWTGQLQELGQNPLVDVTSLAQTAGGRDVWLATVSAGDPANKPAVLVVGSVDARQQFAVELALRLARGLSESTEDEIRQLLERVTFYFIPCPSPDASEAFFTAPCREAAVNSRPADEDGDFLVDEDGPEDLNGDGWITVMRVAQPGGPWRLHPADGRVMIEADTAANETGAYLLLTEGVDNDGDKQYNEDGPGGVDFNRNFTFNYPYFTAGAGPHQVSEPETRAIADFCFDHPNIAVVFSISTEDNLAGAWQPNLSGTGSDMLKRNYTADQPRYAYLGKQYKQLLEEFCSAADLPPSPSGAGSFAEWAYFHFGRFSLAGRGWWPSAPANAELAADEQPAGKPAEDVAPPENVGERGKYDLLALQWMAAAGIDGFADWEEVDNPDFPGQRVEVGGFKPFTRCNPPAGDLDSLAQVHLAYLRQLAELLPRLEFSRLEAADLGSGLYQVDVTVANLGYLPTSTALGAEARFNYPLRYELELPATAKLIGDYTRGQLPTLAGNGGSSDRCWLIQAPDGGSLTLTISSPTSGSISTEFDLASASRKGGAQ